MLSLQLPGSTTAAIATRCPGAGFSRARRRSSTSRCAPTRPACRCACVQRRDRRPSRRADRRRGAVGRRHPTSTVDGHIRAFQESRARRFFVSHDPGAVKVFLSARCCCSTCGALLKDGPPDAVFDYYNAMIARKEEDEHRAGGARRTHRHALAQREAEITVGRSRVRRGRERATFAVAGSPPMLSPRSFASGPRGDGSRLRSGRAMIFPATRWRSAQRRRRGLWRVPVTIALHTGHRTPTSTRTSTGWDRALLFDRAERRSGLHGCRGASGARRSLDRAGG